MAPKWSSVAGWTASLLVMILLAGCGGGDDNPPPAAQPPSTDGSQGAGQFKVPTTRQGPRLGGAPGECCNAVAVSADGHTILGGGVGATWVFTRTNGVWTQQGPQLVGTGAVVDPRGNFGMQGHAVALSADGDTALVGAPSDDSFTGAAWVFTRSAGVWRQQGPKLTGIGAFSVALTADGNTAAIGAPNDNGGTGAVGIFARVGGVWTQQAKLVGTGNTGPASLGFSVALSNDGTTLVTGGPLDNTNHGASWVFTRNGGPWTQQGPKLVGSGAAAQMGESQGTSVALSADGNTALIGGPTDNTGMGASWVFTRNAGTWAQQGPKLVANDAVNSAPVTAPQQGSTVALSDDGNIALIGGPGDDRGFGAAWLFTRTASVWTQGGSKISNPDPQLGPPNLGRSVALNADATTAVIGDLNGAWIYVP